MGYSFKQKVLMFICKVFGHKSMESWNFEKVEWHTCERCKHVYKGKGKSQNGY